MYIKYIDVKVAIIEHIRNSFTYKSRPAKSKIINDDIRAAKKYRKHDDIEEDDFISYFRYNK